MSKIKYFFVELEMALVDIVLTGFNLPPLDCVPHHTCGRCGEFVLHVYVMMQQQRTSMYEFTA